MGYYLVVWFLNQVKKVMKIYIELHVYKKGYKHLRNLQVPF